MWTHRLRLVLRLNATTSFVGGAIAAIAAGWVSETLGIDHVAITRIVGIGLILFAADIAHLSTRDRDRLLSETRLVSAADAAWVIATVVVLAAGILTTTGVVTAVVLGLGVADFGMAQLWFRSKAIAEQPVGTATPSMAVAA